MQPLSQITLGEIIQYGRDAAIAGAVLKLGWSARGVLELVKNFLSQVVKFMASVELKLDTLNTNVNTVMNNHLYHIDEKLEHIARIANDKVPEHYSERLATASGVDIEGCGPSGSL